MSIWEKDCTSVEYEEGTIGGKTFYIKHPKWKNEERKMCFRPVKGIERYNRGGSLCERDAGYGTDHPGQGACRTHGGMNGRDNKSMVHGNSAGTTKKLMKYKVDQYLQKDSSFLMDLTKELATIKVLFEQLLDRFPDQDDDTYNLHVGRALTMIKAAGDLIDKISKIESRNTITANQVVYLKISVADILMKYLKDPETRERALADLSARIPGGGSIEQLKANVIIDP